MEALHETSKEVRDEELNSNSSSESVMSSPEKEATEETMEDADCPSNNEEKESAEKEESKLAVEDKQDEEEMEMEKETESDSKEKSQQGVSDAKDPLSSDDVPVDTAQSKESKKEASPTSTPTNTASQEPNTTTSSSTTTTASIPTDEFGNPLSEYELLRLQRIQRNKERLALLGLHDATTHPLRSSSQSSSSTKRKRTPKAVKIPPERRERISRKTKVKEVNYKELTKIPHEPPKLGVKTKDASKTPHKRIRRSELQKRVPLFMYRELKAMESERRTGLKVAERNLRRAEKECKFAEKRLLIWNRKRERREAKEERQRMMVEHEKQRRVLGPLVQELDGRRWELAGLRHRQVAEEQQREGWATRRKQDMMLSIKRAETKFPAMIQQQEAILANMLLERLPTMSNEKEEEGKDDVAVGRRRSSKKGSKKKKMKEAPQSQPSPEEETGTEHPTTDSTNVELDPENLATYNHQQEKEKANREPKKHKRTKARNVGGPVTPNFSASLQRKWLEGDSPMAPSATHPFVPQVGDIVL